MKPNRPEDQLTIWEIVKPRLRLTDDNLKPLAVSYIREVGYRILHYCNLIDIPNDLAETWASMTIDAARIDLPDVDEIIDGIGNSENIRIGDTSISPASSGLTNTTKSVIDAIVLNYRIDLDHYRKMRWF